MLYSIKSWGYGHFNSDERGGFKENNCTSSSRRGELGYRASKMREDLFRRDFAYASGNGKISADFVGYPNGLDPPGIAGS